MITTETLEQVLRDLRKQLNSYPEYERAILQQFYNAKFELLELLIDISKEAIQWTQVYEA